MRAIVVMVIAGLTGACDGKKAAPTAGSGSAAPAAPVGSAAAAVAAPPAAIVIDAPPAPGNVPPVALGDAEASVIEGSSKLNTAGFELHKKKQFAEAAAKYREAVTADPGNLLARYNLASALVSSGDTATAVVLLAQLKLPDCRACNGILLHAAKDAEWKPLHADATFQSIVAGVTADKVRIKKLFKQVIDAMRSGKIDGLEPYIHPRSALVVSELSYGRGDGHIATLYGLRAFTGWLKADKSLSEWNGDEYTECDAKCCNFGQRGDSSNVVDQVCFAGPGGVLFISSIKLDGGSI